MPSRRAVLALGAIGLGFWALRGPVPELWARYGPLPDFTTEGLPNGFRKLETDADVTAGLNDPFIGLAPPADTSSPTKPVDDDTLAAELFGANAEGRVALHYFTDYNCPYCRVLGRDLRKAVSERPCHTELIYHELPLLGPGSLLGAQAALAAGRQGAYEQMHDALNTGIVRINDAYIAEIARDLSLDVDQLRVDMEAPWAQSEIARTQAIADRFGVIGTPFLLIGKTAIYGRINPGLLARLIDLEHGDRTAARC